jgi:hypothetical protein
MAFNVEAIPQTKADTDALLGKLAAANPITAADSQTVSDAIVAVNAVLTRLNQEAWTASTVSMQAAAADMKDPLKKLSDLKSQLAAVAGRVKTLAGIAGDVESVIGGCKSVFGI